MLIKKRISRHPKSPAQAMIEFALVLPLLLLIIYGLIEVGRLLFIYSSVVSAARQAARYGSTTGVTTLGGVPRYQDCAGMRAAAKQVGFIEPLTDADIEIWHDEGEGANQVAYCAVGNATDTSFTPSTGNISRIRVRVHQQYSPIIPLLPLQPFTIDSISARTILVSVPIEITAAPQGWNPSESPIPPDTATPTLTLTPTKTFTPTATGTVTPTATNTVSPTATLVPSATLSPTITQTPTITFTPTATQYTSTPSACSISHSTLKIIASDTTKVSMTLQNDPVSILTIHVSKITVYFNSPSGNGIQDFSIVPDSIWIGNQNTSPLTINVADPTAATYTFAPNVSKIFTATFKMAYTFTATDKFVIDFVEPECPEVTVTQ